jgi:hypothetical protein
MSLQSSLVRSISIMKSFILFISIVLMAVSAKDYCDNIIGTYAVSTGFHYANKTSVTWGQNGEKYWYTTVSLSASMATYDCSNTTTYSCSDTAWYYDWNKLWVRFILLFYGLERDY